MTDTHKLDDFKAKVEKAIDKYDSEFEPKYEEEDMKVKSITPDVLADIEGIFDTASDDDIAAAEEAFRTSTPEPEPEPVVETLEAEVREGIRWVPFATVFGYTPESVPNHLVPVYDHDNAPEIPHPYIVPTNELELFSYCVSMGFKTNIVGPTGCGKTLMAEYYCAMTKRPYLRISHDGTLDKAAVFGSVHITDGDTDFVPGVLPMSFDEPYLVLLDELTRAPSWANMMYGPLLDRRELALPEVKGAKMEPLKPCDGWTVVASDNTKGNGDGIDKYIDSNIQDAAFLNRWDVVVDMDYASVEEEANLCMEYGIEKAHAMNLAKVSSLLHAAEQSGKISVAFSPRNLVAMSRMFASGMNKALAYKLNYVSRLPEAEVEQANEYWRAVWGR